MQMDQGVSEDLQKIWRQDKIPVIVRKGKGFKLRVRIPNFVNSFEWKTKSRAMLQSVKPRGSQPVWVPRFNGWEIPQTWFSDLVDQLLKRFGAVYIIQPFRPQEICAPGCMNAVGHECNCSCMGANHGSGGPGGEWFVASEAFAAKWGEVQLACRLMQIKDRTKS